MTKFTKTQNKQKLVECKNCNKEFYKTQSELKRSPNSFCSRSCSVSYNNRINPKRKAKAKTFCPLCMEIMDKRSIKCKECTKKYYKNFTIKEYHDKISVEGKHPSWKNAHIRGFARTWNANLQKEPCRNCGYEKHVELCHIKPLASFDSNTKLSVVNSPDNLLPLCRNCHWEFDKGFIEV